MKSFLPLLFALFAPFAWATGLPASLKLSQACWAPPGLVAYLDLRDGEGGRIAEIKPEQLAASLGEAKLAVEQVQPFEKSGEGVAYIFLVDVSKSVKPAQFAPVRAALSDWADALQAKDRMAVLSFGEKVSEIADFTADKALLKQKIQALKPEDKQTALHQGLINAMELGRRADPSLPGRRAVVVLSDGLDDQAGGPTREEVLDKMASDRVPVYAMGLEHPKRGAKAGEGAKALGVFARTSGGDYIAVGSQPLGKVYAELRGRIRAVSAVRLDCAGCPADGSLRHLQITWQAGDVALSDGEDLRLLPKLAKAPPKTNPSPDQGGGPSPADTPWPGKLWFYAAGALAGLAALGGLAFARRRRPEAPAPAQPEDTEDTGVLPRRPRPAAQAVGATVPEARPGPKTRVKLVEIGAKGRQGKAYELEVAAAESAIGRGGACAVSIATDTEISTRHCALVGKSGAVFVRDLGSTNGTRVNGVSIQADYRLQEGDIIGIGRTELRVLTPGSKP